MKKIQQPAKSFWAKTKRGDTIVEVMFAIAIFSLVAVLSISSMNLGVARAQNALELTTARNEINAQAEAIRFIYDEAINGGVEKSRYLQIWQNIESQALDSSVSNVADYINNLRNINSCSKAYDTDNTLLRNVRAFVIDARKLDTVASLSETQFNDSLDEIVVKSTDPERLGRFVNPPINARIVYSNGHDQNDERLSYDGPSYTEIAAVEGMWDYIVKGQVDGGGAGSSEKIYYDFYINACWYGAGAITPTKLDTVIRLYKQD